MKKLLTLLFFTTLLFGESYKEFAAATGYETDYNVALAKAKEEKKDLGLFRILCQHLVVPKIVS